MLNFLIIGDVHSADRNPPARIDNFFEDTFNLLKQIGIIAKKVKADAVFFLGDLFHHKQQKENSCYLIRNWIEVLKDYPPTYAIAGNHDEIYNNPDSIPQQPLGLLEASKALILLDERFDKSKTFLNGNIKVRIAGYPYDEKLGLTVCNIPKKDEDLLMVLAHIYAGPKREDLFGTPIYGYDEMMGFDADIFAFGHYHVDQGVTQRGKKHFINLGAITRGTLSEEDINREPKISWVRITNDAKYEIKKIKLRVRPKEEIFNLDLKQEVEEENQKIQEFIQKLKDEFETTDPIENINKKITSLNLEEDVRTMVYSYLETAGLKSDFLKQENVEINFEEDNDESESDDSIYWDEYN